MQSLIESLDVGYATAVLLAFIPKLIAAIVVFTALWMILKLTRRPLRALLRRADFAETLINLLVDSVYRIAILVLGIVMAASQLGIDVGAALAGIGVVGIAVGFAAQDSLSNTIAGFLIFWDKPFRVGHFITSQDRYGQVIDITMRTTRIRTMENTYVIIPNKEIIDSVLVNHSMYGETRVNVPVGIAYKENILSAREVMLEAISSVEGILDDPAPDVVVTELGNSSVNLNVRVWVDDASMERTAFHRTLEACKLALDEAGIEIPFPHLQLFVENVQDRVWDRAAKLRFPTTQAGAKRS